MSDWKQQVRDLAYQSMGGNEVLVPRNLAKPEIAKPVAVEVFEEWKIPAESVRFDVTQDGLIIATTK